MPQGLEDVILGACGLHPADRFPDARQFRAALTAAAGRLPDDPMGVHPLAIEEDDETTLVPFDTDALVAEVTGRLDGHGATPVPAGLAERIAKSRSKSVDDRSATPGSVVAGSAPTDSDSPVEPAESAESAAEPASAGPRQLEWEHEETVLMAPPTEETEQSPAIPAPPKAESGGSMALPLLLAGVTFLVLVVVGIALMAMS